MPKYLDEAGLTRFYDNIRSQFEHLGVLVLGDSYGEGYTPDGNVGPWISIFRSDAEQYGYTVYSSALGGAAFYRDDSTKKFSTLASNLIATLTDAQKNSIGTVIVGGGYNDRSNTRANIYSGMIELRDLINTNLPNVRRVLVFPFGMGVQGMTSGDYAGFTYSTIVDMVKNYIDANAEARLGTVVSKSNMVLRRNAYFSSDYVHPTGNGQHALGSFVADVFFGNDSSAIADKFAMGYQPNKVLANGVTASSFDIYTTQSDNGFIVICSMNPVFTFSTPFDNTFDNHSITLATFKDAAIQQYGKINIPALAVVRSSTSSPLRYQTIPGNLVIDRGVLGFNAYATTADGTSYLTVNQIDQIRITPLSRVFVSGLSLE